ncbi:elongation factor P--(R)-beta-lysine ligase [Candidatus Pantoea edessiphila]|uniref:Elongation factor P lysine(34) lysyltransferase n=1 Tax=Candidatus Pantoea edessiphila TaxID=2044610 RepID=A0A2P5SW18_9GAMM|nr:elongation factor P--(R)-beta-lysine ligase [Candidatus Pantoea edessiphila]PPI86537.1 elongation factor P lysine(34) lysyltransferase [Candidatus Pantoea edessiphila]
MIENLNWQPKISINNLIKRAQILSKIRIFFSNNGVLEVETPIMSRRTTTDVHLVPFVTKLKSNLINEHNFWLITSPEYHMKRLLAAGSGAIYQITHSFRNGENGRYHNPEFTMLEWYRPEYDIFRLMHEIENFLQFVFNFDAADFISYQQAFLDHLHIDPLSEDRDAFYAIADKLGNGELIRAEKDINTILMLLFMIGIEPNIGQKKPCFVYHFPAGQAILAEVNNKDPRIAERFELYYHGIELANGSFELTNLKEHIKRFNKDNNIRVHNKLPKIQIDNMLLDALQHGMPTCSGVAMGLDRLIMLSLNTNSIHDVMTFPIDRC